MVDPHPNPANKGVTPGQPHYTEVIGGNYSFPEELTKDTERKKQQISFAMSATEADLEKLKDEARRAKEAVYKNVTEIRHLISEVDDEVLRTNLSNKLDELEKKAAESDEINKEERRLRLQLDIEERRAKTRLQYLDRFLEREPAAIIIGGILLTLITVALLVLMFWHEPARDVISNGFLILLGYFFGQAASKTVNNRNSTP